VTHDGALAATTGERNFADSPTFCRQPGPRLSAKEVFADSLSPLSAKNSLPTAHRLPAVGEQTLSAKDIFADSVVVGKEILSTKNWLGKRWTDAVNFANSTSLCCRQRYLFADSLAMLSAKSLHFFEF
jgi:hypothetical protein